MEFLIVLIATVLLTAIFSKGIKRNSKVLYILSVAVCILGLVYDVMGAKGYQATGISLGVERIIEYINNGMLATALFIIVMYIGALRADSGKILSLMKIRAELSIIACILLVGHIFSFTRILIVDLMSSSAVNSPQFAIRMITMVCGFIAVFICIPLFITSFKNVRNKMDAKKWKRLQSLAYGFYALVYLHIMTVLIMQFKKTNTIPEIVLYSAIFISYSVLRIRKKSNRKDRELIGKRLKTEAVNL